jgi:hypothetical protein
MKLNHNNRHIVQLVQKQKHTTVYRYITLELFQGIYIYIVQVSALLDSTENLTVPVYLTVIV